MSLPTPKPTPDTLPFWEAATREELQIQHCNACQQYYFYPRPWCPKCGSDQVEWRVVTGNATLVSYVINQRPLPPFDKDTPIIIGLVKLQEGPRMMTNIVDVEPSPDNLELDMALKVKFTERGDVKLPVFAPSSVVA